MYRCRLASFDSPAADAAATAVVPMLQAGQVGVLPTETVPGLVCQWQGPESIARLQAAKGRAASQKCQFLLAHLDQAATLGVFPTEALNRVADQFWPGPLTLIVNVPGDTVGIRIPAHPWLRNLIAVAGAPLVATSANPPGVDPDVSAANDYADLPLPPTFVVAGPAAGGTASTVCRLEPFEILRQGPIAEHDLQAAITGELSS